MYGIFSYIWLIFMVNVGKYTIYGSYGYQQCTIHPTRASDRLEASLPELPGLVMWRGHEPTMTEPRPFGKEIMFRWWNRCMMKLLLINKKSKQKHSWDCEISQEHPTTTVDFQQLAAPRKNTLQKSDISFNGALQPLGISGISKKNPTNFFRGKSISTNPDLLVFVHRLSVRELFSWTWRSTKPTRKVLRIRGIRTSKNPKGWTSRLRLSGNLIMLSDVFFFTALKCCKKRGWFSWENWEGWNWWNLKVSICWCFLLFKLSPYLYSPMMALNGSIQSLSNCKEGRPKFGYLYSLKRSKDLHV